MVANAFPPLVRFLYLTPIPYHSSTIAPQYSGILLHEQELQPNPPLNASTIPPISSTNSFYDDMFRLDSFSVRPDSLKTS